MPKLIALLSAALLLLSGCGAPADEPLPEETAAVQNIGAYGSEVKDVIQSVRCFDTYEKTFVEFSCEECRYAYRDSIFKSADNRGRYIITAVTVLLNKKYFNLLCTLK